MSRRYHIKTSNCQYLSWTPGIQGIVDSELRNLNHWTGSDSFANRFNYWNLVSEIAIVSQPMQWLAPQQEVDANALQAWLQQYATALESALLAVGLHNLNGYPRGFFVF